MAATLRALFREDVQHKSRAGPLGLWRSGDHVTLCDAARRRQGADASSRSNAPILRAPDVRRHLLVLGDDAGRPSRGCRHAVGGAAAGALDERARHRHLLCLLRGHARRDHCVLATPRRICAAARGRRSTATHGDGGVASGADAHADAGGAGAPPRGYGGRRRRPRAPRGIRSAMEGPVSDTLAGRAILVPLCAAAPRPELAQPELAPPAPACRLFESPIARPEHPYDFSRPLTISCVAPPRAQIGLGTKASSGAFAMRTASCRQLTLLRAEPSPAPSPHS